MKTLIRKALPAKTAEIVLGKDSYIDTLYGCFRLHNPKGDPFAPEREVEIVARSGKKIRVRVPDKMRLDLPADVKACNSSSFRLEKIGKYQDAMHLLTMRAGWNQTDRDISRMIALDPCGSFVAMFKNIPLGTCSTLPLGKNNTWIGMILVHPEARRQGIANAMMQHCVKYAIDSGKIINGLDATPMGNTVYGAVGYVNSYRIWRSVYELAEFAGRDFDRSHVSAMTKKDLEDRELKSHLKSRLQWRPTRNRNVLSALICQHMAVQFSFFRVKNTKEKAEIKGECENTFILFLLTTEHGEAA